MKVLNCLFLTAALTVTASAAAQEDEGYKLPPKVLQDIVAAPLTPQVVFNDPCTYMVQLNKRPFLSLAEQAQTEYRLAGARFNPDTYSVSRTPAYDRATIVNTATLEQTEVSGLPEGCVVWGAQWNPTGDRLVVLVKGDDGIYLYQCGTDGAARKVTDRRMNATQSTSVYWLDAENFIFAAVPEGRGAAPPTFRR